MIILYKKDLKIKILFEGAQGAFRFRSWILPFCNFIKYCSFNIVIGSAEVDYKTIGAKAYVELAMDHSVELSMILNISLKKDLNMAQFEKKMVG